MDNFYTFINFEHLNIGLCGQLFVDKQATKRPFVYNSVWLSTIFKAFKEYSVNAFNTIYVYSFLLLFYVSSVDCRYVVGVSLHILAGLQGNAVLVLVELFNLVAGNFRGHVYFHGYVQVARAVYRLYALAAHTEPSARGGTFGNGQL